MKKIVLILTVLTVVVACSTKFHVSQYYQSLNFVCDTCSQQEIIDSISKTIHTWKIITLKNDSLLEFYKRYYGLGYSTFIKYKLIDNQIFIDSVDIYGKSTVELCSSSFYYSTDSLFNINTGEKFYAGKVQKVVTKTPYKTIVYK